MGGSLKNVSAETSLTNADALVAMARTVIANGPNRAEGTDTHRVVVHLDVHNDIQIPSER